MPGTRPGMTADDSAVYSAALGGLGKLLQHAVALQLRQIIHEQHAVEMIDLVLDAGGEQAVGVFLVHLAVEIGEAHAHLRRPLDFLVIFRDRQAAFLVDRQFFRRRQDFRIDEDARPRLALAVLVPLGEIHRDQPQRLGDLDRRKPDAGRVIHGLEHVVGELADLRRDFFDRLGDQPQLLVRQDDDFSNGHGGRFKLLICRGQSRRAPAVTACLTMNFRQALTMKINLAFTINVPSSFAFERRIGYKGGMNEILFMIGDWPVRTGAALIGFGALALLLLLMHRRRDRAIRPARRANWRWRRRSAPTNWKSA